MNSIRALLLVALAAPASADVLFSRNVHTDEVQTPQGTIPAKDEAQTIWLAKDKLRADLGANTFIVRLDTRKMYVVDTAAKTYSTLDLPVNLTKHVTPEQAPLFEQMKTRLAITALVTNTDETERMKGWAAKKFKVQLSSSQGPVSEETLWTTKDIEVDWDTFWEAQMALRSLQPGSESYIQEMRKLDGVTVKAERIRFQGERKVRSVDELVSAERRDAPGGTYEPPKEFTEKPFDAIVEVRRLLGPRTNSGPGDAPAKPEEKKEDAPRRRKDAEEKKGG